MSARARKKALARKSNVVQLHIVPPQPDAGVVSVLRRALEQAESGELQSVALAGVTVDGGAVSVWAGGRWATLLGATFELTCRLREEGKPS